MEWYFASRIRYKEKIKFLVDVLKNVGQEVSFDWTEIESIKPYAENETSCKKYAEEISYVIKN